MKIKKINSIFIWPLIALGAVASSSYVMEKRVEDVLYRFITDRKAVNTRQVGDRLRYQLALPLTPLQKFARMQRSLDLSFDKTAAILVRHHNDQLGGFFEVIAFSDFDREGKGAIDLRKRPEFDAAQKYMLEHDGSANYNYKIDNINYHLSSRNVYDDPVRDDYKIWLITNVDEAIKPVVNSLNTGVWWSISTQVLTMLGFAVVTIQPLWMLRYLLDKGILPELPKWTPKEIASVRDAIADYQSEVIEQKQQAIIARNAAEESEKEAIASKQIAEAYADDTKNITHLFSHDIKGDTIASNKDAQLIINTIDSLIEYIDSKDINDIDIKSIGDDLKFVNKFANRILQYSDSIFMMVDQRNRLSNLIEKIDLQYWKLDEILETVISIADNNDGNFNLKNQCIQSTKILCDKVFFPAALKNLIRNSFVHNNKIEKKVQLKVWGVDGGIRFKISDNGVGMPPEYLEKWGQVQGKAARLNIETKGSGLGLFSVKKTMDAHRVKVDVKSELKRGSSFAFTLKGKDHE